MHWWCLESTLQLKVSSCVLFVLWNLEITVAYCLRTLLHFISYCFKVKVSDNRAVASFLSWGVQLAERSKAGFHHPTGASRAARRGRSSYSWGLGALAPSGVQGQRPGGGPGGEAPGGGYRGRSPRKIFGILSILDAWRALQKMQIKTFQTYLYKNWKYMYSKTKCL